MMLLIFLILLLLLVSPFIVGIILLARKHKRTGHAVLIIYGGLISFFIIVAQCEKRSTPGHILRWLKGEDGIHQDVNDLAEDVKSSVNPSELQNWAVAILEEAQKTNSFPKISVAADVSTTQIPMEKVPASIRNLESNGSHFDDSTIEDDNRSVFLWCGGPMGHWGMRVGSPTFKVVPEPGEHFYYIEWKPGIYFWCETR
jgi:hypothetical protein